MCPEFRFLFRRWLYAALHDKIVVETVLRALCNILPAGVQVANGIDFGR
jgi:hypothetical protein